MPKFKSLDELENYLKNTLPKTIARSAEIERVMAECMSQAVWDVVYSYYEPQSYERRADNNGLSDVRNMGITDFGINENGEVFITFENLTEGNDSLTGKFTTDTIVEGIEENWINPNGPWSDPRDFVTETAKRLRQNPNDLIQAFKNALTKRGFVIQG